MKKLILAAFLFLYLNSLYSQKSGYYQTLEKLNTAFFSKNLEVLKPYLAKDFSISTYMGNSALFNLQQIINHYPTDSFLLQKADQHDSSYTLSLKIKEGKEESTKMYLNKNCQILRMDLFDNLYGLDRNKVSKKVATLPFHDNKGSIILTVTINNNPRKLRLLFDTGADGMMLSNDLADSLNLKIHRDQQASAVGGNIDIKVSEDNIIHVGDFELPHQSIAIFGKTDSTHDGIIGNTIVKQYITHIDYDKQEMVLYTLGKMPQQNSDRSIPIETTTGNLLFPGLINIQNDHPVSGLFTFDTGAGYNLIVFRPTVLKYKMLVNGFVPDSTGSTISMGIATPVFHGKANKFSLAENWTINNFPITLMGRTNNTADWQPSAAGSLGILFISKYNFTINLVDNCILFQKRS